MRPPPQGAAPDRARARWAKRALVALASALVAGEIGARWLLGERFVFGAHTGPPQALAGRFDPELGWTLRGDLRFDVAGPFGRYGVRTNSRGWRDRERSVPRAAGVRRVAVLGDSTAWGWGVDQEQMFSALLERALGPTVEVLNFAVPGYSTDQELAVLTSEVARYQVDVVLLGFVLNDVLGNDHPFIHDMSKPVWTRGEEGVWERSGSPVPPPAPHWRMELRHWRRQLARYSALAKLPDRRLPRHVRTPLDEPDTPARLRAAFDALVDEGSATRMLLGRVRAECSRQGAALLVFVVPHQHDRYLYDPRAKRSETEPFAGEGPFSTYATRKLAEAGAELGFETANLDAALLEETRRGASLDCGDEHLNARGNQVVAAVLEPAVRRLLER